MTQVERRRNRFAFDLLTFLVLAFSAVAIGLGEVAVAFSRIAESFDRDPRPIVDSWLLLEFETVFAAFGVALPVLARADVGPFRAVFRTLIVLAAVAGVGVNVAVLMSDARGGPGRDVGSKAAGASICLLLGFAAERAVRCAPRKGDERTSLDEACP